MAKWADKLIYEVRFNAARTHIDRIHYRIHTATGISADAWELTREEVVAQLKSGVTFCTIIWRDPKWYCGAMVYIFPVGGEEFIKTVADRSKEDNLDNLPEF